MKHYSIPPLGRTVTHTAGEPSQASDEDLECKPCGRIAEQVGQFRGETGVFVEMRWPLPEIGLSKIIGARCSKLPGSLLGRLVSQFTDRNGTT